MVFGIFVIFMILKAHYYFIIGNVLSFFGVSKVNNFELWKASIEAPWSLVESLALSVRAPVHLLNMVQLDFSIEIEYAKFKIWNYAKLHFPLTIAQQEGLRSV